MALFGAVAAGRLGKVRAQQASGQSPNLFPGFRTTSVRTSGATINVVTGGEGPPLLLLHGAPQTHACWHKVAPALAKEYTVVLADLRGYGDSSKPDGGANHVNYSKRAMAQDQIEVMRSLGFTRFAIAGHDRGGRVAHRLALDHPDAVTKLAVLDIVPTYYVYHHVTREFATAYYHWFFFIRPAPFPETLISNSIELFMSSFSSGGTDAAAAEYLRCFKNPATVHAMCEDYRAAASIDLEHDEVDLNRKVESPLLVLWGERSVVGQQYDALTVWRERAADVMGKGLPGGHFFHYDLPEQTLAELRGFLQS
jgi:haloacetate dehalogenase